MPYTRKQCALFGAKSNRGEKVPADWKQHCRRKTMKARKRKTRKSS